MSKCVDCRKCKFYKSYMSHPGDPDPYCCEPKLRKIKTWHGLEWEPYKHYIKNANGDCKDFKKKFSIF